MSIISVVLGLLSMAASMSSVRVIFQRFHARPGYALAALIQVLAVSLALDFSLYWALAVLVSIAGDVFVCEPLR
eukprot:gene27793-8096_t